MIYIQCTILEINSLTKAQNYFYIKFFQLLKEKKQGTSIQHICVKSVHFMRQ